MVPQKTIIHFIYNLTRGGAETMLVQVIKKLPDYNNVVVTLEESDHFKGELQCDEYICLNRPSFLSLPLAAIELRSLIRRRNVDVVHSHLPLSNFVARLGVPSSIPLITTIHNSISASGDYKKWFIRFLDKSTYNFRRSTIIAVSKKALEDYFSVLKIKKRDPILLYNFVDTSAYTAPVSKKENPAFRAVCVAALSRQKNIPYFIEAFLSLKGQEIDLDIYGRGDLQQHLQALIDQKAAKVTLKGQVSNVAVLLPQYDVFVMASLFEGFSLSVLEAMAAGVPLLLSDIPSFREQCKEHAVYFDLDDPEDFVNKILMLKSDYNLRIRMAVNARNYVLENFTLEHHVKRLNAIYEKHLGKP